jgi:hypothetical protein
MRSRRNPRFSGGDYRDRLVSLDGIVKPAFLLRDLSDPRQSLSFFGRVRGGLGAGRNKQHEERRAQ